MTKLAIHGGTPALTTKLSLYNSMGTEEIEAATHVLKSGCLSRFIGAWGDDFLGGDFVRELERLWSIQFRCKHSVSVNSASSGLIAAVGAIGLSPGDEVIVPPWTMSATVMAPLIYGGIPVFADIDRDTFCLDPDSVRKKLSNKTKAIIAVNLFGHPAPLATLRSIADECGIKLIEDNAQGPLAMEANNYAGTIGHIGVFSLNYHKHIHTGEGGVCVTNDSELALRMQLIRNHAENVAEPAGLSDITNMVGFNFRLTELQAAIGIEQLKKIDEHVNSRVAIAKQLSEGLENLPGLTVPKVRPGCHHVYYTWPLRYNESEVGVSRSQFAEALKYEGLPVVEGYVRPLYQLPLFQKRIAIGKYGYPFNLTSETYEIGMCPVTESLQEREFINFLLCAYDVQQSQLEQIINAFRKVYRGRDQLATSRPQVRISSGA